MAQGFLINNEDDLRITNGVFEVGFDDNDNLGIIAQAEMGTIGNAAFLGGGINRLVNAGIENILKSINQLKQQLEMDKWNDVKVEYQTNNIIIDASR